MKLSLILGMLTLFSWQLLSVPSPASSSSEEISSLNPTQRPAKLKQHIDKTFNDLSRKEEGSWYFSGSPKYGTMFIQDDELISKVVQDALARKQGRVVIVDIGAGNGKWGEAVAEIINQKFSEVKKASPKFQVNIVGLTGENYPSSSKEEGLCTVHLLGAFKIEDLQQTLATHEEAKKMSFPFASNVDLVISSFCFVHLHDPVGTFLQAYNLLHPSHGIIMVDGFPVYFDQTSYSLQERKEIRYGGERAYDQLSFLKATQEPFVLTTFDPGYAGRAINATYKNIYPLLMKRTKDTPLTLTYQYIDVIMKNSVNGDATENVAIFHRTSSTADIKVLTKATGFLTDTYNDEGLYTWFSALGKRFFYR